MTKVISKNKEEFRSIRSRGIGASEISSIIKINPYQTPYQLWHVKTGKVPPFEGNVFTKMGHKLEPVIVDLFLEENEDVTIEEGNDFDVTYFHPNHEYIFATPDRPYLKDGRKGSLECKSTQSKILKDQLNLWFVAQNQYQMGVCGFDEGAIAWLERGLNFDFTFQEFNSDLFDAMLNEAGEFWVNNVLKDIPPDPLNSEDIQRMYNTIPGKNVVATKDTYDAYLKLKNVRDRLKNLSGEKKQLEEQFKMIMKDADSIVYNDETLVTWKDRVSNRLNQKAFAAEQPTLFEYYKQPSTSRTFICK